MMIGKGSTSAHAVLRTRRPLKASGFTLMHSVLRENVGNDVWRYGMRALVNFQFHLIARIDDATQVVLEHIRVHGSFPNALKTRLNYVEDKRDAPWQIALGAMDPLYFVFCSLGLWLEVNLRNNPSAAASPYVFAFSGDVDIPSRDKKSMDIAQLILNQKIFKRLEFIDADSERLGSHSIRKYASTHV